MMELTVPWEEEMEAVIKRKGMVHRTVSCMLTSRAFTYPVEKICRGYTATSTQQFLKSFRITGSKLRNALKDLAEEAEQGSFWLWL